MCLKIWPVHSDCVGNHVLFSDQEKQTVYKLNFEEHNKELFIGKEDTAGFDDGITKQERITSPCGICSRCMALYISEHPENKQGGVRVYSYLSGLISFKSAWRDIALCFGNISKRERLAEKIEKESNLLINNGNDVSEGIQT